MGWKLQSEVVRNEGIYICTSNCGRFLDECVAPITFEFLLLCAAGDDLKIYERLFRWVLWGYNCG
jgi:hypothetical protein